MGRTARYSRVKACDPFSKRNGVKGASMDKVGIWGLGDNGAKPKKRSRTAEKLRAEKNERRLRRQKRVNPNAVAVNNNARGSGGGDDFFEDEFDMKDLQGTLSRQKPKSNPLFDKHDSSLLTLKSSKSAAAGDDDGEFKIPKQDVIDRKEIKEASQLLRKDPIAKKKEVTKMGRQESESKRAYNKRVKTETRQIITTQKIREMNPEKKQRKKDFWKAKKLKKKGGKSGAAGGAGQAGYDNDDYDSDDGYRQEPEEQRNVFQAEPQRPPTFKTLPRGAVSKKAVEGKKKMTTDKVVKQEQKNLERMRMQVQAQYAIIKAKRKQAGDFHL